MPYSIFVEEFLRFMEIFVEFLDKMKAADLLQYFEDYWIGKYASPCPITFPFSVLPVSFVLTLCSSPSRFHISFIFCLSHSPSLSVSSMMRML